MKYFSTAPKVSALVDSPPLEGCQASPDGVVHKHNLLKTIYDFITLSNTNDNSTTV